MKPEWTPGPWVTDTGTAIHDADGRCVAWCGFARGSVSMRLTSEEAYANGRLIAAAPELAALVARLVPWIAKGIADGAYTGCALPVEAEHALDAAHALLARIQGAAV